MKKILSFVMVAVLAVMLAGCDKYDDTELRNKVNGYEARIAALESLASYQTLLQKLQAGKTVTSYSKSGEEITLTFSDGTSVTFNQKGEPGESIQGDPGTPGVTPQFKIEGENWMVSYDEGKTWQNAGQAVEHSLFQNVTADGTTLTITLADGNVINVPYGEKEGYSLKIGNGIRKVYTMYEFEDTFKHGFVKLPYTLNGDLNSIDDVKFMLNITPTGFSYISPKELVSIEPVDANSGYLVVNHRRSYSYFNGEGYEVEFPGFLLDLMAFFPDGSSDLQQIEFLTESLQIIDDSGDAFEFLGGGLCANVGAASGHLIIDYDYFVGPGYERYDGPELADIPCNILVKHDPNYNAGVNCVASLEPVRHSYDYTKDAYLLLEYKFDITYPANTTSAEKRYLVCSFVEHFKTETMNFVSPIIGVSVRQQHP